MSLGLKSFSDGLIHVEDHTKTYNDFTDEVDRLVNAEGLSQEELQTLKDSVTKKTKELVSLGVSAIVYRGKMVESRLDTEVRRGTDVNSQAVDSLFANVLHQVNREVTYSLPAAMAVGVQGLGVTLFTNPIYLREITNNVQEVLAIIRHECYHLVFRHLTIYKTYIEKGYINRTLMNLATDCQINQIVDNLPEGTVTLETLERMTGEKLEPRAGSLYYIEKLTESQFAKDLQEQKDNLTEMLQDMANSLKNQANGQGSGQDNSGGSGNSDEPSESDDDTNQDNSGQSNPMNQDAFQDAFNGLTDEDKQTLMDAIQSHDTWKSDEGGSELADGLVADVVKGAYNRMSDKTRGLLPGSIQESVGQLYRKKSVDWKSMVKKGFGTIPVPYKLTKKRMNRRQPNRVELRGKLTDRQVHVVVFVDTSGSMSDDDLMYALSEMTNMVKDIRSTIDVVISDSRIQDVFKNVKDMSKVKISGRGGTVFQPAYDYLHINGHTNRDTLAVYFTDGFGEPENQLDRKGFTNMYWVLTGEAAEENHLSVDPHGRIGLLRNDIKRNKQLEKRRR